MRFPRLRRGPPEDKQRSRKAGSGARDARLGDQLEAAGAFEVVTEGVRPEGEAGEIAEGQQRSRRLRAFV